jgi:aminopeptidase-like protein
LPESPDWIPYRTSYYRETWGFCLTHRQRERMKDGEYEVCIDSSLESGHLTYAEYWIQGETNDEVLFPVTRAIRRSAMITSPEWRRQRVWRIS